MKIWIDDVKPAPEGYMHCVSVNQAILKIQIAEIIYLNGRNLKDVEPENIITIIDIDHDAGDYASDGGDYIKLLDWLEETGRNYPIRIHSQNPVGVANMRRIIQRNGWKEIKQ